MSYRARYIVKCGLLGAAIVGSAACGPKPIPPMTVEDLMDDRVTLDGVLLKCNQDPSKVRNDVECRNARVAIERLAKDVDPAVQAKRNADFERSREQLRQAQEKVRQAEEAKAQVDPYNLPLIPVETAPAASAAPSSGSPPSAATTPAPGAPKL